MTSVRCPECNLANWATSINCKRCGYFLQAADAENASPFGAEQHPRQFSDADSQNFQASEQQANNQSNWSQTAPPPNNQNYRQPNYQNSYQPHYAQNDNYSGNQAGYGQNNRYAAPERKSGMAIASMVLGLVGCFLASPVGLILGIVSLKRANRSPFEYGGKGFAIAGIVLNSIGLFTLPIIAAIAIPNLLAARRAANESSAISIIKTLAAAEEKYRAAGGGGNRCGDLQKLQAANLIDPTLAAGQKNGYRFLIVSLPTVGGGCEINAAPLTASHGTRSFFYSTEDDTLRAANKNGHFAAQDDAPLNQGNSFSESNAAESFAEEPADEAKTIANLRTIFGAQATYGATVGQGKCGTLQNLAAAKLIGEHLATGQKNGYRLEINRTAASATSGCETRATPISGGGNRSFYVGGDGVIHGANKNGGAADKNDPPIDN